MNRKAAKTYIIIIGAFSTTVAFMGTLVSDGIKGAFLMGLFVALLFVLTGIAGLQMFWPKQRD